MEPTYVPQFFINEDFKNLWDDFQGLWDSIHWQRRPDAPRFESWMNDFGASYTYGRGAGERTYTSDNWNLTARLMRLRLESSLGTYFEACFINGYKDASDHLGWHADDSVLIDHSKPIAVVSFGAAREIWTRPMSGTIVGSHSMHMLGHGSLFLMPAGFQQTHQHRIPKANRVIGPRISFTYRSLLPPVT